VREDPEVTARMVTGPELAEYLSGYLRQVVEAIPFFPGLQPVEEFVGHGVDEIAERASHAVPRDLFMEPAIAKFFMNPGDSQEVTVSGYLEPGQTGMFAIETSTPEGSVISEVIELQADDEGRIYEL